MKKDLPARRIQRRTILLPLALLIALTLTVPALAHGHHGGRRNQAQVTVCTVKDCDAVGRHTHNGVTYCGSCYEDGCCEGRCLALCPVEGCDITGRHIHDGVTYCGNDHAAGYCTGSCAAATAGAGYRHGCHH